MKQAYEYLVSLATITLVIAGLGGLAFHAFRESGWIPTALAELWAFEMQNPLIAMPLTLAAVAMFITWRNHYLVHGTISRVPPFVIYGLMGAGAYFIGHYALRGSL